MIFHLSVQQVKQQEWQQLEQVPHISPSDPPVRTSVDFHGSTRVYTLFGGFSCCWVAQLIKNRPCPGAQRQHRLMKTWNLSRAQIPMEQHSYFRWLCRKAWKLSLTRFWINLQMTIATKVSLFGSKWNTMIEIHVETCIDRMSFNFWFEDFLSNLSLIIIINWVTDQQSITWSWRSLLIFKFSVSTSSWFESLFWGQ